MRWKCLHGDTKVKLTDNRDLEISKLYEEYKQGKSNYVYSVDSNGHFTIERINGVKISNYVNKLYKITLDSGESIKCTGNHRFMLRDGTYKRADELSVDDSMYPFYTRLDKDGYLEILDNQTSEYVKAHYLSSDYNERNNLYEFSMDPKSYENSHDYPCVRHHIDINKLNNDPTNITRLSWGDHGRIHNKGLGLKNTLHTEESQRKAHLWQSTERGKEILRDNGRNTLSKLNYDEEFQKKAQAWKYTEEGHEFLSELATREISKKNNDKDFQDKAHRGRKLKLLSLIIKDHGDSITELDYVKYSKEYGYKKPISLKTLISSFGSFDNAKEMAKLYNHKVISIEVVKYKESIPVYDIMINNESPCFVLSCGIVSHNSGMHTIPTGSSIKNIYTSRYKGGVIMAPDYSQMEVRAIAATAHEDSMLEAFRNNADIHRMNACFRGDTKLLVIDPSNHLRTVVKTIKELAEDKCFANNEFEVWSYDYRANGKLVIGKAHHPRKTETGARRVKVTLANDDIYYCTYDHKWLNGNNYWMEISELKGYYVRLSDGSEVKVKDVEYLDEYFDVYDITVDYYENFVVVNNNIKTVKGIDVSRHKSHILKVGPVVHNSQVWRKPPEEVTAAERRFSKMVTFAILYGANAQNIANNFMGGDLKQAEDMLDKFYTAFPKLKTWIDSMHHLWKETGIVTTLTNRIIKIPIPEKSDPKYRYKYSQKLRQAQNFPIN